MIYVVFIVVLLEIRGCDGDRGVNPLFEGKNGSTPDFWSPLQAGGIRTPRERNPRAKRQLQ